MPATQTIREGYRLAVLSADGEVLDTIDLAGFDLTRPAAAAALADDVRGSLPSKAFE